MKLPELLLFIFLFTACTTSKNRLPTDEKEIATSLPNQRIAVVDNCGVGCPLGGSDTTLVRPTHTLNNNSETKFANWVAYKVTQDSSASNCPRTWRADPLLNPSDTLVPADYTGANAALRVDRGHLAPLAALCGLAGRESLNFLSNITPQMSALNQGPWERLENQERLLARHKHIVYVVTGPLYESHFGMLPGTTKVHTIPSGYWKVIFLDDSPVQHPYAAFILPQETPRNANFCDFQVTVAQVEARSGIHVWSDLKKDIQENLKSIPGQLPGQMGCATP